MRAVNQVACSQLTESTIKALKVVQANQKEKDNTKVPPRIPKDVSNEKFIEMAEEARRAGDDSWPGRVVPTTPPLPSSNSKERAKSPIRADGWLATTSPSSLSADDATRLGLSDASGREVEILRGARSQISFHFRTNPSQLGFRATGRSAVRSAVLI